MGRVSRRRRLEGKRASRDPLSRGRRIPGALVVVAAVAVLAGLETGPSGSATRSETVSATARESHRSAAPASETVPPSRAFPSTSAEAGPSTGSALGILALGPATGTTVEPAAGATPVGSTCPGSARYCVMVDATDPAGPVTHAASGFLLGTAHVSPTFLTTLAPTSWRVDVNPTASGYDFAAYDTARQAGAAVVVLVSNAWFGATSHCPAPSLTCGARPPWADLGAYSTWVRNYVRAIEATGRRPDYWDVQNEPDGEWSPGSYFNVIDAATVTTDRVMAQFGAAYGAVKSVDPTAKLVGPSLSGFWTIPDAQHKSLDLTTFLDYSATHALAWGAVAWHENGAGQKPGESGPPPDQKIPQHVATAQAMLAARPSLGSPVIALTEYGQKSTYVIPGWMTGEIAAIESSGVALAERTCWPSASDPAAGDPCFHSPSTLDGLLLADGRPTSAYWVRQAYSALSGPLIRMASSDVTFSGLAAIGGGDVVRILVGRHATCTSQVNPDCSAPASTTPPPADVTVQLRVPWSGATNLVVQQIPNVRGAVNGPTAVMAGTEQAVGGDVSVVLPHFSDGDSFSVVVRPSG